MDTMKVIYKILEILEKALDDEDFDFKLIEHDAIGISEHKWNRVIGILQEEGLIEGFTKNRIIDIKFPVYFIHYPAITFKGLVYLAENSSTSRIINAAKLIKDIVPFT